jgi:hypothetical protein
MNICTWLKKDLIKTGGLQLIFVTLQSTEGTGKDLHLITQGFRSGDDEKNAGTERFRILGNISKPELRKLKVQGAFIVPAKVNPEGLSA